VSILILTQIAAALWQSTPTRPPEVDVQIAWIGAIAIIVPAVIGLIGAVWQTRRINRANVRSKTAQDTADEAKEQGEANAKLLDEYENRFASQFKLIQDLRSEVLELRQEVFGWRAWSASVLAVIQALPDGAGAHIEEQLPPMPTAAKSKRKGGQYEQTEA
jgi:uncharacterized protein YnzC (UPF0291/DUF896 family)